MQQTTEREITLQDYIEILKKRKFVIFLSVAIVTISSILFVPSTPSFYKATALIIVEGSPYNIELMKSIKNFVKTTVLAEEVLRYMEFEEAKELKKEGEFSKKSLRGITPAALQNFLLVENEEGTDVIKINALSNDGKTSMNLANTVANVVVEQSVKGMAGGTQASLKYVERQIELLSKKMDEIKRTMTGISSGTKEGESVAPAEAREFDKLQQDYINAKLARQMAEAQLKVMEDRRGDRSKGDSLATFFAQSPELRKLQEELVTFEEKRKVLLVQFTEEHPKVVELQLEIDRTREAIDKEIRQPLNDLKAQIAEYKEKEDTLRKVMETRFPLVTEQNKDQPVVDEAAASEDVRIRQLSRELNLDEKTYNALLDEREKLRLDALLNAAKVRVLRPASEPDKPEKPEGPPPILIALSLGLVLGLSAAFLQENVDTSLKTLDDVEYYLNLPIIGVVPFIRADKRRPRRGE
ncbi:MAG: GNVR domain-containing protein [Candidatus Omnitrophota bacterium]